MRSLNKGFALGLRLTAMFVVVTLIASFLWSSPDNAGAVVSTISPVGLVLDKNHLAQETGTPYPLGGIWPQHESSWRPQPQVESEENRRNGIWGDLGLNLVSEAIGILVTVGVIDHLIRRREERRWKPARGLLSATLLELTDRVLFWLIPSSLRVPTISKYDFEGATANRTFLPGPGFSLERIPSMVKAQAPARSSLNSSKTEEARNQLGYILRFSSFTMEATLFHLAVQFDRALSDLKQTEFHMEDGITDDELDDYAIGTRNVVERGMELIDYLLGKATDVD